MKKCFALLAALVLVMGLFAGCGSNNDGVLTTDDAKKIVCEDLKLDASKANDMDVHMTSVDALACYAVYVSVGDQHWEYVINSLTGEILERNERDSGHSH